MSRMFCRLYHVANSFHKDQLTSCFYDVMKNISRCCCDTWIVYVVDKEEVEEYLPLFNELLLQTASNNGREDFIGNQYLPEEFLSADQLIDYIIENNLDNVSFDDLITQWLSM